VLVAWGGAVPGAGEGAVAGRVEFAMDEVRRRGAMGARSHPLGARPSQNASAPLCGRARSHCRFRNRGAENIC
jgi:hypothetical protein